MIEIKSMCTDHSLVYPNCDVTLFSTEWASLSLSLPLHSLSLSLALLSLSFFFFFSLLLTHSLSFLPHTYTLSLVLLLFFFSFLLSFSLSLPLSLPLSLSLSISLFLSISTAMLVGWLSLPIGWSHVMRSFRCDEFACTPTPTWIQMFWRATSKKPINHYYLFPT